MKKPFDAGFKVAVLGGGQLGRMLIGEAIKSDVRISILDPDAEAPCAAIAHEFVCGSFHDYQTVIDFGKSADVVTVEIENVNTEALFFLQKMGVSVFPRPEHLKMIKDKGLQKNFYQDNGIPTADFVLLENGLDMTENPFGFPVVQKLRTGGYDGRGVAVLKSAQDMQKAFNAPVVLEKAINIDKEISVLIARNVFGQTKLFPVVESIFNPEVNLVDMLVSPATISVYNANRAAALATELASGMKFVGLLAVEMFLTKSGELLINEIAPRPHNSGHHTIEANGVSQFAAHLRAILNWPLMNEDQSHCAAMINLLGSAGYDGPVRYEGLEEAMALPGVYVHLYGKHHTKPFRKMGHITVLKSNTKEAMEVAKKLKKIVQVRT